MCVLPNMPFTPMLSLPPAVLFSATVLVVCAIYYAYWHTVPTTTTSTIDVTMIPDHHYTLCQATYPNPINYQPLPNAHLVHIQVITRHGDRTPAMSILPNEENVWYCDDAEEIIQLAPYLDGTEINAYRRHVVTPDRLAYPDTAWPGSNCRRGQLTRKGILQHVLLGQQLRRIYVEQLDVLPDKLDVKALTHLYFRSSDVQRTRQSAAALLSGLWPNDKRSKNIKITPISVYPKEAETMWGHLNECPRAAHLAQAIRESEMYMNFLDRHTALRSQLEMKLGTVDHKGFSGSFIRYSDAIYPRYCHGLPLPCGPNGCISEEEAELLSQCMSEEQSILRYQHPFSAEFNRLTLGHFLGELRERLLATVYRTTQDRVLGPTRFDLFSGHDVTIYTILGALHATDLRWPPYASSLIYELWRMNDSEETSSSWSDAYQLRILYNGKPLKSAWCQEDACPLSKYLDYIENYIPYNLSEECQH